MSLARSVKLAAKASSLLLGAAAVEMTGTALVAGASATGCANHVCLGADGSSTFNAYTQWYSGEIGNYRHDFDGVTGPCPGDPETECYNSGAAQAAATNYKNGNGPFQAAYYFGGGSLVPHGATPYCWGRQQGYKALKNIGSGDFPTSAGYAIVMELDVEDPTRWGWSPSNGNAPTAAQQQNNRKVFNGFYDIVEGKASADSSCTWGAPANALDYQAGLYSDPSDWSWSTGSYGTVGNALIRTYQNQQGTNPPGNLGNAAWFGGGVHYGWQYNEPNAYDEIVGNVCYPYWGFCDQG